MALRAKKPEVKDARLKVLLYADKGVGKTHFCCSFPDAYYIDTEGLEDYPHLVGMLETNGGQIVYLNEISEIIKEVTELLSTKHSFKTLIIDSISFPYAWLAQAESERLAKKSPNTEGTEFGANLAKAKRLTFQLGILLSRLDMNVIVVAHEKQKFIDNKDAGKTFDINDKLAYSLGAVWNLKLLGKRRKLFVEKSRYSELNTGDFIDFDEGYEVIKGLYGEHIFIREVNMEKLATPQQIKELTRLLDLLKINEEAVGKLLTNAKAATMEQMTESFAQKAIDKLLLNLQGVAA
ncbi:MAG TPA: AAA family ATPase [Puia sp.]|nr:AAA family ATPase [Puia sp.]